MIPHTGNVRINLIIALCVTCEKKGIVPVHLCVVSTGFPVLEAEVGPMCTSFPQLFPEQIDEKKHDGCSVSQSESDDE